MKKVVSNAFEVARIGFCLLLLLTGCGMALSGAVTILAALWISITGANSDWAAWFMALVGVVYCVVGGFSMLLAAVLFRDKHQQ